MTTIYFIDIDNGVFSVRDVTTAPRKANEYLAPNAKQYFEARGKKKPDPVKVKGWPFKSVYLERGTEENGLAVAWA